MGSSWKCRPEVNASWEPCDGINNYYPWDGFIIRNNLVYDVGGDGIVNQYAEGSLVEYNVVHDANVRSGTYNAGIWAWNADNVTFQYNEAYLVRTTLDGQGFDIDYGQKGTIFQYNYSHDNEGGFMLVASPIHGGASDGIVRYNISQNDRERVIQFSGASYNTQFYNNTIYVNTGNPTVILENAWEGTTPVSAYFYNNIFYNLGSGNYTLLGASKFENNIFYGNHPSNEPSDPNKITSNPNLVNPGSGGNGITSVGGYQLQSNSPAIAAGRAVASNGGLDFWGNAIPQNCAPDIGAHQFSAVGSDNCAAPAGLIPQSNWALVSVDSEETAGEDGQATNAFDGNPGTIWHTQWQGSSPTHPHEIQIDLGDTYNVSAFRYLPRQDNSNNGSIANYQFYVSTNTSNWGTAVATGTFASDKSEKEIAFNVKEGRYIRLVATSEVGGNAWTSAAEIQVLGTSNNPLPTNTPTATSPAPTETPTPTATSPGPTNTPTVTSPAPTNTPTATPSGAGRFEAESLPRSGSDNISVYNDSNASNGQWVRLNGNAVGDYVEYTVNVSAAGTYNVSYGFKRWSGRGVVQLYIDGVAQGGTVNQSTGSGFETVQMGSKALSAGNHTFRFEVAATGNNNGEQISVDFIELE